MISDKLYKLAFEFKKVKLWQSLLETMPFAVRLSDGRIGYICIEGFMGKEYALDLYIGDEGFASYRRMAEADWTLSPEEYQESFFGRQCLQCIYKGKDEVSPDEREDVKRFARANNIKIAGKNAYPQFMKYQPSCLPWHMDEKEQELLCEALTAAIWIAGELEDRPFKMLGFRSGLGEAPEDMPMLEQKDGAYFLGRTVLPEKEPRKWPEPEARNDIGIASLKRLRKAGVYECEIIRFPEPVQYEEGKAPIFPMVLLAVENASDYLLPVSPVAHYDSDPEELLNLFIEALICCEMCPKEIKVQDERTYAFVKALCGRLKISLSLDRDLSALESAKEDFFQRFCMSEDEQLEEAAEIIDRLFEIGQEGLDGLPSGILEQMRLLAQQGVLPDASSEKLEQLLDPGYRRKPEKKKSKVTQMKSVAKESYVISVSLGRGCYRHIRISGSSTLFQLHEVILESVGFDDDHAHAFFMDNRSWSDWDSYYSRGVDTGLRLTDRAKLEKIGLYKEKPFKYVFDFGDEWTFQCKVLRVLEGDTGAPEVIKSKGEAPPQYGDFSDDWDDADE